MSAHGFALPCACSLGCSAPPCAPSGRVRPSGARSGVVFREPGPCTACGVSIVSINCQQTIRLLTQESSVHSGNCPFIPFVPSIMSIRASQPPSGVSVECAVWSLETYWYVVLVGVWRLDCGLAGHWTGVRSHRVRSGEAVWTGRVEKIDVLCGLCGRSSPSSHIGHGTSRPALRSPAAPGGAGAGGGRRSHITHVRVVSCMVQSLCITS